MNEQCDKCEEGIVWDGVNMVDYCDCEEGQCRKEYAESVS